MRLFLRDGKIFNKEPCEMCSFGCVECNNMSYNVSEVTNEEVVKIFNKVWDERLEYMSQYDAIKRSFQSIKRRINELAEMELSK